ncbi:MAG: AsmA family protein [Panacagrimonas sp.]
MAVIVVLCIVWDWNWVKGPLEQQVRQQTGRRFSINGDLDVDLGWRPTVVMNGVQLGNPSWTRQPQMFTADRAAVTVDLRELIAGRLSLPEVALSAPHIDLETAPGNENNWQLASQAPGDTAGKDDAEDQSKNKGLPKIGRLRVDRGELIYFDPIENTDILLRVSTDSARQSAAMTLEASGRLRSLDFEAQATGGALLALADTGAPYPFDCRFRIGRTRGTVGGTVTGLQAFSSARLQLDVRGDTLSDLHRLTSVVLPETPPYHVAGLLIHEGPRWTFDQFTGTVGDSDLGGSATVTYVDDRTRLDARLESRLLDMDDLGGFVGAKPQTGKGETASARQKKEVKAEKAEPRVLPDEPVNLAGLRAMDADVHFTGHSIRNQQASLERITAHLVLDHGVLSLDPLNFGIADGTIVSSIGIDARKPLPDLKAEVDFNRLDLAKLVPGNQWVKASAGLIGGHAQLRGSGASTAALLGSMDGELGVAMRDGKLSNLLIEGVGLDAAEAVRLLVGGDHTVKLRCAVVDLAARNGVITPRSFLVDTADTNVHVEGSLSLQDETLDLAIHPLPKDFSPLTLRSPLHVRGTFKEPDIGVDKAMLLRGGAAAILAALVNPLAALLPLIETGPGKDENCAALIAAVKHRAESTSSSGSAPVAARFPAAMKSAAHD